MYDESIAWSFIREISLDPRHPHLVAQVWGHPPLSGYLVKASSLLFGESDLGLRVVHVLLGDRDRLTRPPARR